MQCIRNRLLYRTDEAMSGVGQNDLKGYANGYLEYYDYTLMRDINTHLSKLKNVTVLSEDERVII